MNPVLANVENKYLEWMALISQKPTTWYFDEDVKKAYTAYCVAVKMFRMLFNSASQVTLNPKDSVTIISSSGRQIAYLRNVIRPNVAVLGSATMVVAKAGKRI